MGNYRFSLVAGVAGLSLATAAALSQSQAQQTFTIGPDQRLGPACFCLNQNRSSATVVECTTSSCSDGSRPIALENGADIRSYLKPQPNSPIPSKQIPGQSPTQPPTMPRTQSVLATADPEFYHALQQRFALATQLCRAGDQPVCDHLVKLDAAGRDVWLLLSEEAYKACQSGDQSACRWYQEGRDQTFEVLATLQWVAGLGATPQAPTAGSLQGRETEGIPAAAGQWEAIDPELTQAIFQRYAAVTKLCQSGHQGACTWLNDARRPEGEAELLVGNLQRTCIRTTRGWDLPSPQPIMGTDYGQWTCNANKQNRDDAIASASDIIENADRDAQRRAAQHEHDQRMEQSKRAREQADRTYRAMHDLPPRGNAVR
jgi:hypothetical protein